MPSVSSPPKSHLPWRTTNPWQHRGEARRNFGTSKDVMPASAGYTSGSLGFLCKYQNHSMRSSHV